MSTKKLKEPAAVVKMTTCKRTSIGGGIAKLSSMNRSKKASWKKYRGQGRV